MINTEFRITPRSATRVDVHWTAPTAGHVSWIFVNGRHRFGPMFFPTAERSVPISFNANELSLIEIHDNDDEDETISSVFVKPNTRPFIRWNSVADAVRYRIFHKEAGGSETLIWDEVPFSTGVQQEIISTIKLNGRGGVWHFFRVESVDEFGNESTRESWRFLVLDVPLDIVTLTVEDGSSAGLYDFTLT